MTVGTNYEVVGGGMHYASAVSAWDTTAQQWHWVVAFQNCAWGGSCDRSLSPANGDGQMGWSYSSALSGAMTWSATTPGPGTEEVGAWQPLGSTADGSPFVGWSGDPYVARVGSSASTLMMVGLVASNWSWNQLSSNYTAPFENSDVGALISTDGGRTWLTTSPEYITTAATGIQTDQPQIVTNPNAPYSTFVAWTSNVDTANVMQPPQGWMTSINTTTLVPGSSATYGQWTGSGMAIGVNSRKGSYNDAIRPKLALNTVPVSGCSISQHEMVYIAWTDFGLGNACNNPTFPPPYTVNWWFAAYDNATDQMSIPQLLETDTNWPGCVAAGNSPVTNANRESPYLAADTTGQVAIVYDHSSPLGARIRVNLWNVTPSCHGPPTLVPHGVYFPPDPCYSAGGWGYCGGGDGGTVNNGADGGIVINDQWGAQVNYVVKSGVEQMLVTWYDTVGDVNNSKTQIRAVLAPFAPNPFTPTTNIFQVSTSGVPWFANIAPWVDYQTIAADSHTGTPLFLAAWGGDSRLGGGVSSGVWSSVITP